nr:hypothetical protein [Xanthomonas vasicola]
MAMTARSIPTPSGTEKIPEYPDSNIALQPMFHLAAALLSVYLSQLMVQGLTCKIDRLIHTIHLMMQRAIPHQLAYIAKAIFEK